MATSQEIERNVMLDIKAVLDEAEISDVFIEHNRQPEKATFVRVAVLNLRDPVDGGTIPTGMRQIEISVEPHSYEADDKTGSALAALVADCRAAIYDSEILATLNTKSTYHTYYGMMAGDDLPDVQENYRLLSLQFSLVLKPDKEQ